MFVFQPYKITVVQVRGTVLPRPRSGHVITCDDVRIYCFGGYNQGIPGTQGFEDGTKNRPDPYWNARRPLFRELWSFSIANRKWKQHEVTENMMDELLSNAMCMYGSRLMIYGGTGYPHGKKCNNNVLTWPVGAGDAKLKILNVRGQRPPSLYGQATFCDDQSFYTIGGTNGYTYNSDVHRLNLQTLEWETIYEGDDLHNDPPGRYKHHVARDGNKIYIIGGGTHTAHSLTEIPVFDLETKTWSVAPLKIDDSLDIPMGPFNRKSHTAVQIETPVGPQVFVCGGTAGLRALNDVWKLDIKTSQWTLMRMTVVPQSMFFHSATVTSSGCMYTFGGIEPQFDPRIRSNKLYKTWLCIPKLSDIAWEAVLHYQPNLELKSRKVLLDSGIPQKFVDRVAPIYPDDEDNHAGSSSSSS